MRKDLEEKWEEAKRTGKPVDVGNIVVCDICDEDYTDSKESGGFLLGSYGYCPKCSVEGLKSIKRFGEEKFIRAFCPTGMPFAEFILLMRRGKNTIQIKELKI